MTSAARKILDEAMALGREERAEIAAALSASLDSDAAQVSSAWAAELAKRIEELNAGTVTPVTLAEVEARIAARLSR